MLVAAELFPEARYDPLPILERTDQPVLALWGELDQVAAPMESAGLL
jgi:hypothetical protein